MQEPNVGRHSLLRRLNHAAVLERLARNGAASRVELSDALTLSQASVSRIADRLLSGGLLAELPARSNGSGRPQVPLALRGAAANVAVIDIRRNRYRVRLAGFAGDLLAEVQAPMAAGPVDGLPASGASLVATADQALARVLDLLHAARDVAGADAEPVAVVLAVSAAWDHTRRRVFAARNLPYLEGVDLQSMVEAHVSGRVKVENGVRLAALGELELAEAAESGHYYYLSLGSGIAGANVVAGRVYDGSAGLAGEVGYLRVRDAAGAWTDLEGLVGRVAVEMSWAAVAPDEPLVGGLERAPANPREAAFRADLVGMIVSVLAAVATVADPPLVILGGSLGSKLAPLLPELEAALAAAVPNAPRLRLRNAGPDGALAGGIRLALELAREQLLAELLA